MKHHHVVLLRLQIGTALVRRERQAGDQVALARVQRVTAGRQHHTQSCTAIPLQLDLVEFLGHARHQHVKQIGLEAHQNRLCLRVAHAAVEFQRLDLPFRVNHQTRVEEASVGNALLLHALQGRQDDFPHRLAMHIWRDHGGRGISTHAPGVGAFVAVQQPLVVLRGGQSGDVFAVTQHDEAGLFASQKFFNDDARPALVVHHAQRIARQHEVDRLVRLGQCHRDDHAFACGQAIRLDDDGHTLLIDVGMGSRRVGEGFIGRGGNTVALHEGLGKRLGAFQLRSRLGWAKDFEPVRAELIHHTGSQWAFWPNHCQCYFFSSCPSSQFLGIAKIDVDKVRVKRGSAIAGSQVHLVHFV